MWRNILVQSTFQLVILLVILEQGNQDQFFGQSLELGSRKHNTIIFNIFVFCQVCLLHLASPQLAMPRLASPRISYLVPCTPHLSAFLPFCFPWTIAGKVFNELNARSIGDDVNVFQGIGTNWMFQLVIFFTVITQFLIVEHGGDFTQTESLTQEEWMKTVVIGGLSLPLGVVRRAPPP